MARWAVFDIDGTLLPGTSLERLFIRFLIKKRILGLGHLISGANRALQSILIGDFEAAIKRNKAYLSGCSQGMIQKCAAEFNRQNVIPQLAPAGIARIETLRRDGHKILLLSGSPDFLADGLRQVCQIDHIIATQLEVNDGRYTGIIMGTHPFGTAKTEILLHQQNLLAIDFKQSVVFANHETDVDHMALFARAVAVNPTEKLQPIAAGKRWGVEWWEQPESQSR